VSGKILLNAGPSARGWHRLEAFLRCATLYSWGYGQAGSNPERAAAFPSTVPLVRGSIGHVGLAHCYARVKAIQEGTDPDRFYPPLEAMRLCADSFGDLGQSCLPVAVKAVRAYAQRYGSEPFRVLSVEEPAETIFEGYRFTARIDLIIEDAGGKVWILDHKFVSRIDSKVRTRYILSGQFLGLSHLGFRLYGSAFAGVRLNLVGCNVPGFSRETIEPAPWMLERFPHVVKHAEEGIAKVEALLAAGEVVPASPSEHTCMGSYGPCPAFDLCRWGSIAPHFGEDE
jgi:hypothetical protein